MPLPSLLKSKNPSVPLLSDGHTLVLHSMVLQKEIYGNPTPTCLSKESFVCVCACVCVEVALQKGFNGEYFIES